MKQTKNKIYILQIIEGEKRNYWKFENEGVVNLEKNETPIGYCKEAMDFDRYCAFKQLSEEIQAYIVETLIAEKKVGGEYIYLLKYLNDSKDSG